MGFSISWIAFEGLSKTESLARAALIDTAELDEANEAPFSCAALSTGWTIIFSNDFDYFSPVRLAELSVGARVIGAQVEEHIMYSSARAYGDGAQLWSIVHDSSLGILHLEFSGDLPAALETARASAFRQQDEEGGEAAEVDFVFDVPVEVAAAECGYRHDRYGVDGDEVEFTVARRPGEDAPKSILGRLKGFFG